MHNPHVTSMQYLSLRDPLSAPVPLPPRKLEIHRVELQRRTLCVYQSGYCWAHSDHRNGSIHKRFHKTRTRCVEEIADEIAGESCVVKTVPSLDLYLLSLEAARFGFLIALKFDRHLGSSATEMPVTFRSDTIIITPNHVASRLYNSTSI